MTGFQPVPTRNDHEAGRFPQGTEGMGDVRTGRSPSWRSYRPRCQKRTDGGGDVGLVLGTPESL